MTETMNETIATASEATESAANASEDVRYGTRWGRSALLIVPAVVAVGAIGSALATGVLALDIATQNGTTSVVVNNADLAGASIYPVQQQVRQPNGTSTTHWYLAIQIKNGVLGRLCTTQTFHVPGVDFSLKLDLAGPVTANGVLVTISQADIGRLGLDGVAVRLNEQASDTTVGTGGAPSAGGPNLLSIQADSGGADAVLGQLHTGNISDVTAASIAISVSPGASTC